MKGALMYGPSFLGPYSCAADERPPMALSQKLTRMTLEAARGFESELTRRVADKPPPPLSLSRPPSSPPPAASASAAAAAAAAAAASSAAFSACRVAGVGVEAR